MSARNVTQASFSIERVYPAKPARVFRAFSDIKSKAAWFHGPDEWKQGRRELDFRAGGREIQEGGPVGGPIHVYHAIFQDITPDERIVYSYDLSLGPQRISVSLASIELQPEGPRHAAGAHRTGCLPRRLGRFRQPRTRHHRPARRIGAPSRPNDRRRLTETEF